MYYIFLKFTKILLMKLFNLRYILKKLILSVLTISLFLTCSSESSTTADNNVYIDPGAATTGNGTSSSPYKSWSSVTFIAGKSYLQKRGTVAREQITVNASGKAGSPIVIGAYGSGALPVILGSEIETGWTLESGNIYSKQMSLDSLGMVTQDGIVLSRLIWNTNVATTFATGLAGSFTFNPSDNKVYARCTDNANPNTHTIEVSRRYYGINGVHVSYVRIENIEIRNVSLHGIQFEDSSFIDVSGCEIKNLGGAYFVGSGLYAGNGIEFGNQSTDCSVANTTVENIFDSGVSPQTYDSNTNAARFVFSGLTISKCGFAGIEVAVLNTGGTINSSIDGVTISDSIISECGKGYSGIRYGNEGRGIKIKGDGGTLEVKNIIVNNCIIRDGETHGIAVEGKSLNVSVNRCTISGNKKDGILAQSIDRVNLSVNSSVITGNATGGSAYGITMNLSESGSSLLLIHNTFYENTSCEFTILGYAGSAITMKNNLFHTSGSIPHIYSAIAFPAGSSVTNNWFKEFSNMISYNGTSCNNVANFETACTYATANIGGTDPSMDTTTFRLTATTSPCYQKGVGGTGVTTDRSGASFANPPSIGAFEY